MSILSVNTIQPIGSGNTITLNASEVNVGAGITIESNGQAEFSGIITAAQFSGNGAITINTNSADRLITGSGSANTLNGQVNLTFDGNTLVAKNTTGSISATQTKTAEFWREDGTRNPRLEIKHNQEGSIINHTYSTGASDLMFQNGGSEKLRITGDGKFLFNNSSVTATNGGQFHVTNTNVALNSFYNNPHAQTFMFAKSRGTSGSGGTIVNDNDFCGHIEWYADDGVDTANQIAKISGRIDGTPGANNTPGELTFYTTATNANASTERLRIASNGKIHVKGNGGDSSTNFSDEGTFLNLKHDTYGGRIGFSNGTASAGIAIAELFGYWGSNKVTGWLMQGGGDATNRDDGQMSFYTTKSGESVKERLHIGTEGQIVSGYRVGTSSVRSNQPVAFHSANITPHGNLRRVSTGQRCNLFVGSNTGWSSGDGGVIAMGGSETGGAGVEATWAYVTGKRQSGNGWEYAGYFEVGTSPYSGTTMAKRVRIWANGQIEIYPTDNTFFSSQIGGAQRLIMEHTGGGNIRMRNASSGSVTYQTTSDYRLKENVVNITNALTTVKSLKPYEYKWKHDGKLGQGFFAHEAQAVLPDIGIVTGTKDEVHAEDETENGGQWKKDDPIYQSIDYSKLVPLLTASIQELSAKVESLEEQNIALRARITNLEGN